MASIHGFTGQSMVGARSAATFRSQRSFFLVGIKRIALNGVEMPLRKFGSLKSSNRMGPPQACNTSVDLPLLSMSEVTERLAAFHASGARNQEYTAMYSSIVGGVTTNPAAMVIPMDDHMVHRGHGIFDTAAIMDGHLYELDQHLDRFLRSASMAKICPPFDRSTMRSIIIQTVSLSKCKQGSLRYWLSAGPGDFQLTSASCMNPAFYVVVIQLQSLPSPSGCKVITSTIPMKPRQFSIMKSTNYLPNVLSKMEAEEKGAYVGIWLDEEGFIAEGPNMNVAFVTKQKELVMPSFDKILSGCTAKRVLALADRFVADGRLTGVRVGNVTVEEGKKAEEMMLIGSGVIVKPVLQWDDKFIGDGKEGPIAKALYNLIVDDMKSVKTQQPQPYQMQQHQLYPTQQHHPYLTQQPQKKQVNQGGFVSMMSRDIAIGQDHSLQPMEIPTDSPYSQAQNASLTNQQPMHAAQTDPYYNQNMYTYRALNQENISI